MNCVLIAAAWVAIPAGCGGGSTQPPSSDEAGELRIEEVHVAGAPFAIEGELTYYSVERDGTGVAGGKLDSTQSARVRLRDGRYTLKVWHRVCDGNCTNLDPPSERCEQQIAIDAKRTLVATIRNRPGSGCRVVVGRVGIAYVRADVRGSEGWLWFANGDGSGAVRLARASWWTPPALSPDGRKIAFVRSRARELRVISPVGGPARLLRRFGRAPSALVTELAWSPDSSRLAVGEGPGLMLVDVASGRTRLFARGTRHTVGVSHPTFAPDGQQIAYERSTQTSVDVHAYASGRTLTVTRDHRSLAPSWGPTGLAFARGDGRHGDIWSVIGPGAAPRRLTRTNAGIQPVAWSADGRRLLAANPAQHNGRLWAVDVPSGRARALTPWVGDLYAQGLSRDGETILAAIGCGGRLTARGVVETLPFAGGEPHVIVKGPCRASWNG
jgi:Tol biopolymer transport system component